MNSADKKIADILMRYGEPFAGNVWRVQGTAVLYHKALERIATQADIEFSQPQIIRAERDEAVVLVNGSILGPDKKVRGAWSFGEAVINQNYKVSGKQAAYPWAMAEKRAKDRVILKLIELSGLVYSEEEADDFRRKDQPDETVSDETTAREVEFKKTIDACLAIQAVTDLMRSEETQSFLNGMPESVREEIREYAKDRLFELGWQRNGPPSVPPPAPPAPEPVAPSIEERTAHFMELKDRLGFARSYQEVEEAYDDFDAEAVMSAYPNGVELARDLKQQFLDKHAPTTPEEPEVELTGNLPDIKVTSGASGDFPGNEYIEAQTLPKGARADYPDAVSLTPPAEDPIKAYREKLQDILTNAKTREELEEFWLSTSSERDACGASAQAHAKWKSVKNRLSADLPTAKNIEVDA